MTKHEVEVFRFNLPELISFKGLGLDHCSGRNFRIQEQSWLMLY